MFLQAQTITQALGDSIANQELTAMVEDGVEGMNLFDMALKGGWIMVVLLLLSLICFYIFFNRIFVYKKSANRDVNFMNRIKDYVTNGELKSAINFCQAFDTPFSRIIQKGIQLKGKSRSEVQAGMENAANVEIARLEKGLSGVQTIASAAPMIGFLGTVTGMVRAFWEMSNAGNNIDVSLLSGGIYEAMITTVGGLIVGILALFAYNYLASCVDKLTNEMESFILDFVETIEP